MTPKASQVASQIIEEEWIAFPGGELEGRRPKALCPACRTELQRAAAGHADSAHRAPLCFQCYRTGLARERALGTAGDLDTSSATRIQFGLPFESRRQPPVPCSATTPHPAGPAPRTPERQFTSVNKPRLAMLRAERAAARQAMMASAVGRFADRRRRAQIAARLAVRAAENDNPGAEVRVMTAVHAAELQLPESWLPFVVGRG